MKTLVVVLLLGAAVAVAQELPVVGPVLAPARTWGRSDAEPAVASEEQPSRPVWERLAAMSPAERANAEINVELPQSAPAEAQELARAIDREWNAGRFEAALELFAELGRMVNPRDVAVGCSWREPIPTAGTDWGSDVRVGNRDTINKIQLDIHRASGNLFAVVLYHEGTDGYWSVNLSTNGGASWSETFTWSSGGIQLRPMNATVLGGDLYIFYSGVSPNRDLRVRRVYVTSGTQHGFQGGVNFRTIATYTGADSIREIAACSNQDFLNNRLYVFPLFYSGKVQYWWDDTAAISWDSTPSFGVSNAWFGIDASANEGFESTFVWVSYVSDDSRARLRGRRGTGWREFRSDPSDDVVENTNTSVGAWKDTVLYAFVYPGGAVGHVRYMINYQGGNPGSTWYYLWVGGDSMTRSESPDVALRDSGGSAIIYRYYSSTRELRYVWRRYTGAWSTPVSVADGEPYWNHPAVEHLGGGAFGVLYLNWRGLHYRAAYFDRSDWTGIAEQRRLVMEENILNVLPNPLSGAGQLRYTLDRPAQLTVRVYDRSGRVVQTVFEGASSAGKHSLRFDGTGLAPGVYFIRADADGDVLTVPVTVVR
ncbi:MAG: FlgD immunoglobulin-like domain containing protein [candidate division WOR-3 bacterium]